jgi:hypothetical protein
MISLCFHAKILSETRADSALLSAYTSSMKDVKGCERRTVTGAGDASG